MDTTTDYTLSTGAIPHAAVWSQDGGDGTTAPKNGGGDARPPAASSSVPLHRLSEVRRREGITRHTVASRLGISEREVQRQEHPCSDMLLSELHRWRKVLQVPTTELLFEPDDELSASIQLRAQLLRMMKTVRSIEERARQASVRRLAGTLVDQIAEIMPELRDTKAWPAVGQQRSQKEPGQAYFRRISRDSLGDLDEMEP